VDTVNKSLSELDGKGWQDKVPTQEDSYVIRNSYELYNKPLNEFDTEDLRFITGQRIGLEHTIPIAIEILRDDILAEGDYFEGDLLESVLRIDAEYWSNHPDQKKEVEQLFISQQQAFEDFLLNK